MDRIVVVFQSLAAFLAALCIKLSGDMQRLALPDVAQRKKPLGDDMSFLVACADWWVRIASLRTRRKCFFRSYVIAAVLRRHGEEAELNIGMRDLAGGSDAAGHCWVTSREGVVLGESDFLPAQYPVFMGRSKTGVRFWAGGSRSGR